jgi:hypothetical protein
MQAADIRLIAGTPSPDQAAAWRKLWDILLAIGDARNDRQK